MKPLLFTFSIFTIMASSVFSLTGCKDSSAGDKGPMSFYTVPLVCFAAPEIGCGSMTKPLFMAAQQVKEIKAIWLDRPGTHIAIEWNGVKDTAEQEGVIRPLLAKYNIQATLVGDTGQIRALTDSLELAGKWYKGMEIDELSREEAGVIAGDVVKPSLTAGLLTAQEGDGIKGDITAYFRKDLVKVRNCSELRSAKTQQEWKEATMGILEKHLDSAKSRTVYALYEQSESNKLNTDPCCNKQGDCCHKK